MIEERIIGGAGGTGAPVGRRSSCSISWMVSSVMGCCDCNGFGPNGKNDMRGVENSGVSIG